MIDLSGGEAKVLGNAGDTHTFRLSNPEGQTLIESGGEYEAEFVRSSKSTAISAVSLNLTELEDGKLIFTLTINDGIYRFRRLNPRRTLLTIEVESK